MLLRISSAGLRLRSQQESQSKIDSKSNHTALNNSRPLFINNQLLQQFKGTQTSLSTTLMVCLIVHLVVPISTMPSSLLASELTRPLIKSIGSLGMTGESHGAKEVTCVSWCRMELASAESTWLLHTLLCQRRPKSPWRQQARWPPNPPDKVRHWRLLPQHQRPLLKPWSEFNLKIYLSFSNF